MSSTPRERIEEIERRTLSERAVLAAETKGREREDQGEMHPGDFVDDDPRRIFDLRISRGAACNDNSHHRDHEGNRYFAGAG